MKESILNELKDHVIDLINSDHIVAENIDVAHHIAFNEDYYIIGYWQADQWLKKHDISPWEAIAYVIEQGDLHFGESYLKAKDINSETIANQLVFFAGYDLDIGDLYNDIKGHK